MMVDGDVGSGKVDADGGVACRMPERLSEAWPMEISC